MDVWPELVKEAALISGIRVLPEAETAALRKRFVDAFVSVAQRYWWWEALREDVPTEVLDYQVTDASWPVIQERLRPGWYVLLV